jgi:hypothetical protein
MNFLDGIDFFDSNQFGFLSRSSTTSAGLVAAVSRIRMSLDRGVTLQQYLSMSLRHSTVPTILYCSQNFFDKGFVGMDLKSFKIISLQGLKLFRRCKAKALKNL